MKRETEIIVIGGGILGASLTYYLAKGGKKVILLEKEEICSGTSGATAALALPSPKTPKFYTETAWKGYERMKQLSRELRRDFELQITGTTMLCRDPEKEASMKETVEINRALGRNVRWVTREEISAREPLLNPKAFCGGVHCDEGGNLNPFLLVNAYVQAAKVYGAEVWNFTEVVGFDKKGTEITVVHTSKGDFRAEQIICGAGNGSIVLGRMLGVNPHIRNTRGLLMVSERMAPVLHSTYAEMRQAKSGNLIMGANFRELKTGDVDKRVHYGELMEVAEDIGRLAPELKKVKIIRTYSGIRILPEDDLPIIGRPAGYSNFWFYLMHSAFSSAPELSYQFAEILGGNADMEAVWEYRYGRFEK